MYIRNREFKWSLNVIYKSKSPQLVRIIRVQQYIEKQHLKYYLFTEVKASSYKSYTVHR